MRIVENGAIGSLKELYQALKVQDEILSIITNTPISMINDSYKKYREFCYICGNGKCIDIQTE